MSSGNADPGTAYCMDVKMTSIENVGYTSSRDCSGYRLAVTVIYIGAEIKDRVCGSVNFNPSSLTSPSFNFGEERQEFTLRSRQSQNRIQLAGVPTRLAHSSPRTHRGCGSGGQGCARGSLGQRLPKSVRVSSSMSKT